MIYNNGQKKRDFLDKIFFQPGGNQPKRSLSLSHSSVMPILGAGEHGLRRPSILVCRGVVVVAVVSSQAGILAKGSTNHSQAAL